MTRAIAQKVRYQPALIRVAKGNLERWIQQREPDIPAVLIEWREILTKPLEEVLDIFTRTDEDATRLRQSSPFCGILSEEERRAIFQEYEALRLGKSFDAPH